MEGLLSTRPTPFSFWKYLDFLNGIPKLKNKCLPKKNVGYLCDSSNSSDSSESCYSNDSSDSSDQKNCVIKKILYQKLYSSFKKKSQKKLFSQTQLKVWWNSKTKFFFLNILFKFQYY